jgi:hypothetical protein
MIGRRVRMSPLCWTVFKLARPQFASLDFRSLSKLHIPADAGVTGAGAWIVGGCPTEWSGRDPNVECHQSGPAAVTVQNNPTEPPYSMNQNMAASNG